MNKKVSDAVPHLKSKGMKAPKAEAMHMNMPQDVRADHLKKESSAHPQSAASEGHDKQDTVRQAPASKGGDARSAESKSSMPHNPESHPMSYNCEVGQSEKMHDGSSGASHAKDDGGEASSKHKDMNEK